MPVYCKKHANLLCFLTLLSFLIVSAIISLHVKNSRQDELWFSRGSYLLSDYYMIIDFVQEHGKNIYTGRLSTATIDANYPALAYIPFYSAVKMFAKSSIQKDKQQWLCALIWLSLTTLLYALLVIPNMKIPPALRNWLCVVMFFSGIYLFAMERGNCIFISWLCVSFFLFYYRSENRWLKELSFLALAIAAGMKIFPALLGILVLCEKDWKGALRLCIYGILFFFLPFLFFEGGMVNLIHFWNNCTHFCDGYSLHDEKCLFEGYCTFLYSIIGLYYYVFPQTIRCIGIIAGVFAILLGCMEKTHWRKILLFSFALVLIPPISFRYNLLYLFPGIVLFFNEAEDNKDNCQLALFWALLLSPLQITWGIWNLFPILISLAGDLIFGVLVCQSIKENGYFNRFLPSKNSSPELPDCSKGQPLKRFFSCRHEVLAYFAAGGWNTLFGMGLYGLCYRIFGTQIHYLLLAIPVNILAISNAFLCYKLFVFKTKGNWLKEYFRCYLVYGGGTLLGMGLLWLLVHFCRMQPDWANVLGTVIVVIGSFCGHKYFSFRKAEK